MYRHYLILSPLARACRTGALLLVLVGILGLLAHTIVVESRPQQVVGSKQNAR